MLQLLLPMHLTFSRTMAFRMGSESHTFIIYLVSLLIQNPCRKLPPHLLSCCVGSEQNYTHWRWL